MENETSAMILADLNEDELRSIINKTSHTLDEIESRLLAQADQQPDAGLYRDLTGYCCLMTREYIRQPENMRKILTDSTNIEGIYASITDSEGFKAMAGKEYLGMPRVLAMSILTGVEMNAVLDAEEILILNEEEKDYLQGMAALYKKYMQEAMNYALGEKKVSITGDTQ